MRKVVYGGAMSPDGFIAGPNSEYDWIVMDPDIDFAGMTSRFDTFLIGASKTAPPHWIGFDRGPEHRVARVHAPALREGIDVRDQVECVRPRIDPLGPFAVGPLREPIERDLQAPRSSSSSWLFSFASKNLTS